MTEQKTKHARWSALLQVVGRMAIGLLVLPLACVWADTILRVSQSAAEVVLSADELRALADDPGFASDADRPAAPSPANDGADANDTADGTGAEDSADACSAAETADGAEQALAESATAAASAALPDRPPGDAMARDVTEPTATVEGSAASPLPVSSSAEGSLASFAGSGPVSSGEANSATGLGAGPAWEVTFAVPPTADRLSRLPQTRLAACRPRRGFTELILIERGELSRPMTVEDFLQLEPGYQARQGIVLGSAVLRSVEDRLVVHGGGWQAWLLVEDQRFACWLEQVRQALSVRNLEWPQVARISAQLQPGGEMVIQALELHD